MKKKHVLLVEDNIDNFELVRFLLERAGFEVIAGRDGKEGVQLAHQELPDLILMDLSLPVIDGWTAARELKADPVTKRIPLMALTAHTLPGDRRLALESGFDGFISKPIDVANFGEIISRLLVRKKKSKD